MKPAKTSMIHSKVSRKTSSRPTLHQVLKSSNPSRPTQEKSHWDHHGCRVKSGFGTHYGSLNSWNGRISVYHPGRLTVKFITWRNIPFRRNRTALAMSHKNDSETDWTFYMFYPVQSEKTDNICWINTRCPMFTVTIL